MNKRSTRPFWYGVLPTTKEILNKFNEKFRNERWYPNNWEPIEKFIAQALSRKDEEWKEKIRGLRMERIVCTKCGKELSEEDEGYEGEIKCSQCGTWENPYDWEDVGWNQAIYELNKRVDDLLK